MIPRRSSSSRLVSSLLPALAALLLLLLPTADAARIEATLRISWSLLAPDCFSRPVLTINGSFPGPTLRARRGDEFALTLCNDLHDSGVTIHWHGLHQRGTPFYDGVSGVTQCPIQPMGGCQRVGFNLTQQGSFFYHVHHAALAADGAQGMILVSDAPSASDALLPPALAVSAPSASTLPRSDAFQTFFSLPLAQPGTPKGEGYSQLSWMLTDWFHDTSSTLLAGLDGPGASFRWVNEPNSLLLNGKGTYCADRLVGSNPTRSLPGDCAGFPGAMYNNASRCGYPIARVSCSEKILLHVINAASLSYMELSIEGHVFEIVGTDGLPVTDTKGRRQALELNSGERMDVLLTRDDNSTMCNTSYWRISVRSMYRTNQPQLYGILHYIDAVATDGSVAGSSFDTMPSAASFPMPPTPSQIAFPTVVPVPQRTDSPLESLLPVFSSDETPLPWPEMLPEPDQRLLLVTRQERDRENRMRWTVNGVAHMPPVTPSYFLSLLNATGNFSSSSGALDAHPSGAVRTFPDLQPWQSRMFDIALNSWVEIILQNSVALNGVCEQHAWHLHGMHAIIVGQGDGTYRPGRDNVSFELRASRALRKDSFTVFPRINSSVSLPGAGERFPFISLPGSGCGWTALRVHANNPGTWLLHCHIGWHGMMGMNVVLHVRSRDGASLPGLPHDASLCGDPEVLYRPGAMVALMPSLALALTPSGSSPSSSFVDPSSRSDSSCGSASCVPWYDAIVPLLVLIALVAGGAGVWAWKTRRRTSSSLAAAGAAAGGPIVGSSAVARSPRNRGIVSPQGHVELQEWPEHVDDASAGMEDGENDALPPRTRVVRSMARASQQRASSSPVHQAPLLRSLRGAGGGSAGGENSFTAINQLPEHAHGLDVSEESDAEAFNSLGPLADAARVR